MSPSRGLSVRRQDAVRVVLIGFRFSARDFLMRLVFLVGVSVAGWMTRAIGVQPTLLMCAVVVAGAGALSFAWGWRVPELMRTSGEGPDAGDPRG